MRAALTIVFVLAASGACGHKQPTGGGAAASGSGSVAAVDAGGGGAASGSAIATGDAPVTRDECVAVLGHIVDVGLAEKKKSMPADQAPTEEDAAKARQKVVDAGLEECMKMPRAMYACAIKAQDAAALRACDAQ